MSKAKPVVLIVDDEPDSQQPFARALEGVDPIVCHPRDVTAEILARCDLVLVDVKLETWGDRDRITQIAMQPINGLAVVGILREFADRVGRPIAFAIRTAHLAEIWFPPEAREHAVARGRNLEWAFSKTHQKGRPPAEMQAAVLASAVQFLPREWPIGESGLVRSLVQDLLGLARDTDWEAQCWEDIEAAHAPIHDLSRASHGLAFVRWLLHRILPYPCFLWGTAHLAVRLRVSHRWLRESLASTPLASFLQPVEYLGILRGFAGPKYWRSGVESLLWSETDGNASDVSRIHQVLLGVCRRPVEAAPTTDAVVCTDENGDFEDEPVSTRVAVRIQPDDWPTYADHAWTRIALANTSPRLRALVTDQDRARLE